MNHIITNNEIIPSHIEDEEFFSLRVVYDSSFESNRYIGFYYGETDLLELSVNRETGLLKKLQVVVCAHYTLSDETAPVIDDAKECSLLLDFPQHNECNFFLMTVYSDGVFITLSNNPAVQYYKCGQVVYGLTADNNMSSILIAGMSETNIAHTKYELTVGVES